MSSFRFHLIEVGAKYLVIVLLQCTYLRPELDRNLMARRLRGVLQETIHSTQGAFVQGRQILDAVLIANEIVDKRKRSGEEGVVFKIDFEKTYDHVKWDFLDHVLEKKGFSAKWRSWMRGCLSSVSYAIIVNGNAKGWVKATRGLRQGDPLSPFLFTIVADVLSRMLLKAEERNLLEGFRVGRNRCRVTHLQFADDTILFASPREDELQTLKCLLLVFGQISGLKVNLDKSNLFGINLDQNHLSREPNCLWIWDPVIKRISRRLDGWQKTYLSFGDSSFSGCKNREVTKELSMVRGWEGKRDHLVRWEVVCKPRIIGGLGFGKIPLRNRALLGKWLWSSLGRVHLFGIKSFLAYTGHTQMVRMPILQSDGHTAVLGRP
ncbi:LINE-1 retrotransposable element ORF2 protein [Vitis vinifera]|uniref:LINE-1 retrotransposable element ORF2 protein n=1 Tax=Vitis vinifera TaxID=29760 RepID=A0A438EYG2_VITVI|nr:LINE-1 retrotransposable element ORF2 protein [Vitis vinifera]